MASESTDVRSLLTAETILVGLPSATKDEVIRSLASALASNPHVRSIERLIDAVLRRERAISTAVGNGLALPHARTDAVSGTVAVFAVTAGPVEFDAVDGMPVRLVFLLAGPASDTSRHIRILSRVSRLMNRPDIRESLVVAANAQEVLEVFEEAEAAFLA